MHGELETKKIVERSLRFIRVIFFIAISPFTLNAQNLLSPFPTVPAPKAEESAPMGDWKSLPEMKLDDLPIAPGPFKPTWESIDKNYPGVRAWLREAKFGIWVHFGPQSAGESGDCSNTAFRRSLLFIKKIATAKAVVSHFE